ncbi:hypothetical protein BJ912DRAFT_326532 [Pholiota molesta]|nr:hypothetical protein BJ912DRAFT_326532 [Pholiota molesta]
MRAMALCILQVVTRSKGHGVLQSATICVASTSFYVLGESESMSTCHMSHTWSRRNYMGAVRSVCDVLGKNAKQLAELNSDKLRRVSPRAEGWGHRIIGAIGRAGRAKTQMLDHKTRAATCQRRETGDIIPIDHRDPLKYTHQHHRPLSHRGLS